MSSDFLPQRPAQHNRGYMGYAMLRIHCGSRRAYTLPKREQRPRLEYKLAMDVHQGLCDVALPEYWLKLVNKGRATYSSVTDGVYEIETPTPVDLNGEMAQDTIRVLTYLKPEMLREQDLIAIKMFFVSELASQSFLTHPSMIAPNARPQAMAVDPQNITFELAEHADALYKLRRANCNGYQYPGTSSTISMLQPSTSTARSPAPTHTAVRPSSAEVAQLLERLKGRGSLPAILDPDSVAQATQATTSSLRSSHPGSEKRVVFAASSVEPPPVVPSTPAPSHAQPKSILKTPLASPARQDVATEELNQALIRQDILQNRLDDAEAAIQKARDELKAEKRQSAAARVQLEDELERKTKEVERVRHEIDKVIDRLERQKSEFEATKDDLQGRLKHGEDLEDVKRTIKKIKQSFD